MRTGIWHPKNLQHKRVQGIINPFNYGTPQILESQNCFGSLPLTYLSLHPKITKARHPPNSGNHTMNLLLIAPKSGTTINPFDSETSS